jgi:alanine-glyoxylate transaminase/serine-glyoxylate transaminase/serine-pyruvate transaminase
VATRIGLQVDFVAGDWRHGVDPAVVYARLADDRAHMIKAVCVVHNETSTGVVSRIAEIRTQIDEARHPALLLVDTISSLGSIEYRHEEWGVDVTIGCSQKGLMLPPGISFNAISDKALAASTQAKMPRAYWDWEPMLRDNKAGFFPYTPSTNILFGLREALLMVQDEGLDNIVSRHERFGRATRAAVKAWGLDIVAQNPAEYSGVLTAVIMPDGRDADRFRQIVLDRFDMSLGTGLGKLKGKIFRIGHLGDLNDLTLAGTLSGVEMGLKLADVPHKAGGVLAAMDLLATESLTAV